jgi:hypothetical protein
MNYDELVELSKDVGLNDNRARIAAAIALAESGGNPSTVVHDSDDDSYGLWQINMKGPLGPQRRHDFGLPNNDALLDARRNAMVMAHISSKGGNFSAWTTYTSGKYKDFLKDKSLADKAADLITGAKDAAGNVYDNTVAIGEAAGTIASATTKTAAWLSDSKNWIRIGYVAGGGLIVLVAVGALLRSTPVGAKVASVATKQVTSKVKAIRKTAATKKGKASAS